MDSNIGYQIPILRRQHNVSDRSEQQNVHPDFNSRQLVSDGPKYMFPVMNEIFLLVENRERFC